MADRAQLDKMGEINTEKAFSEINVDEDAIEKMSPRMRNEIQTEI